MLLRNKGFENCLSPDVSLIIDEFIHMAIVYIGDKSRILVDITLNACRKLAENTCGSYNLPVKIR